MKNSNIQSKQTIQGIFSKGLFILPIFTAILIFSFYSCTTPYMVGQNPDMVNVTPPEWAPEYDNGNPVNYYYLPDIECYYDLRNREFVYMEEGNWRFSAMLPSVYASFDLNNCFVVKLNNSVHEPWMHFQYYVAHYPRYYYKSIVHEGYGENVRQNRWFNENVKHSGYNNNHGNNGYGKPGNNADRGGSGFGNNQNSNYNKRVNNESGNRIEDRQNGSQQRNLNSNNVNFQRSNSGGNRNEVRQNTQPSGNTAPQHNEARQTPPPSHNGTPQRNEGSTRQAQPMKYYGKQIGQPVKVQRYMMKQKESDVKVQKKRDRKGE